MPTGSFYLMVSLARVTRLSLSLSLAHTHTHRHPLAKDTLREHRSRAVQGACVRAYSSFVLLERKMPGTFQSQREKALSHLIPFGSIQDLRSWPPQREPHSCLLEGFELRKCLYILPVARLMASWAITSTCRHVA